MVAPRVSKPHAVCVRSLAELTIENPPISSTLIFVCGGPLEPPRVSSSLSESEPGVALVRFREGPPVVLPSGGEDCGDDDDTKALAAIALAAIAFAVGEEEEEDLETGTAAAFSTLAVTDFFVFFFVVFFVFFVVVFFVALELLLDDDDDDDPPP